MNTWADVEMRLLGNKIINNHLQDKISKEKKALEEFTIYNYCCYKRNDC